MIVRDGVTEVVVPETVHGHYLAAGRPPAPAAVFFTEVLGRAATIEDDAWVFGVRGPLASPRIVSATRAAACAKRTERSIPRALAPCVLGSAQR